MEKNVTILVFLICIIYHTKCLRDYGTVIREDREILLGGYFGVHQSGNEKDCGNIDDESGIYLVEAMRYAVENINRKKETYLAGHLGYRIVDTCSSIKRLRKDTPYMILNREIAGIVGPATSGEAILASISYGIFKMAVISYSATSIDLSDREKYDNFYRTVPSDDAQVTAILDILKSYNWTYVSTVNSDGNYGQRGMDTLISMFTDNGICISSRNVLPAKPTSADFAAVMQKINSDRNAKAVVLFTTAEDTNALLRAVGSKSEVVWLSSSAWTADMETVRGVSDAAKGALVLNYANINSREYMKHFKGLKLNSNRYGWFEEFWNKTFSCHSRNCTGNESIAESKFFGKYAAAGAVIDAVNAFGAAIECNLEYCGRFNISITECSFDSFRQFRHDTLLGLQHDVLCDSAVFNLSNPFDATGSLDRDIEIINFDGETYVTVGTWTKRDRALEIDESKITWYDGKSSPPKSICSMPCKMGERKVQNKIKECCFTCHACGENEILVNNSCIKCAALQQPGKNKTRCINLEKVRIKVKHYLSVIVLLESSVGIILNTIVLVLFLKNKDSKIVKASSRELSIFMLAGFYLCFISPCIFLLNPTVVRCGFRRFIFGLSLTACYTPLMLKTNRIYRIFKAARFIGSMPYLVSPASQIFICFGLLALQLLLSIMWVVGDPPVVSHVLVKEYTMVADLCGADILTIAINLVPCFCMLAVSTVYAFKSRKFPKNYNEAFNIGITMYISCVLWAIFIPALLMVKAKSKNPFGSTFVIANFSNVIGLVSLAGLFGPKIRRLLLPRKGHESKVIFSTLDKSNDGDMAVGYKVNEGFDNDVRKDKKCEEEEENAARHCAKRNILTRKSF